MTRWGIVADVHANEPALQSSLERLNELGAERIVSAGDAIGYGPHPNECVQRLRAASAIHILGNHELFVLGRLSGDGFVERARQSLAWTQLALTEATRRYLLALPEYFLDGELVVAHAALDDDEEYILARRQASRQFAHMRSRMPETRLLVLGHTHQALAFSESDGAARRLRVVRESIRLAENRRYLLNPGSVGQSRQFERYPRARFMLLDTGSRVASWFAIRYDDRRTRLDLERAGLPSEWVHIRPSPGRALRRTAKGLLR